MERFDKVLSLKDHCIPCGARCCKISKSIGSPILSEDEKENITKFLKEKNKGKPDCFKRIEVGNECYYIIKEKDKNCYLLNSKHHCTIQEVKPLDCLAYPVKAIFEGKNISLIMDKECPALNFLSPGFIEQAKRMAIKSIERFSPQIYNHWLKKNVDWINQSAKKIERLNLTM